MGVGITPKFTQGDIRAAIAQRVSALRAAIVRTLQYLGEKCVVEARDRGSYMDQTGNLRSSVGYVVTLDGNPVTTGGFKRVAGVMPSTKRGEEVGLEYALKRAASTRGYALTVVAGMDYAQHVEAFGRNVLSSAEQLANRELPRMLTQLRAKL